MLTRHELQQCCKHLYPSHPDASSLLAPLPINVDVSEINTHALQKKFLKSSFPNKSKVLKLNCKTFSIPCPQITHSQPKPVPFLSRP
jgi:hypothetical protein